MQASYCPLLAVLDSGSGWLGPGPLGVAGWATKLILLGAGDWAFQNPPITPLQVDSINRQAGDYEGVSMEASGNAAARRRRHSPVAGH